MIGLVVITLLSNTLAASITGTERSVELMPDEAVGIEHGNINLTCLSKVYNIGITTWTCPDVPGGQNVFVDGNKCNPGVPFDNETKYLWDCNDSNQTVVTIKDISRRQHGDKWVCQVNGAYMSNEATLYVKVPVEQVTIRIQASQQNISFDVNENEVITVICNTSESRPNSSIALFVSNQGFDVTEIISQADPLYEKGNHDLWHTIETFSFISNRTSNKGLMYCNASNDLGTLVTSTKIKLNIKYPPNQPPRIDNLRNGSYSLIEGSEGKLTCSTEEANPMANLTWICNEKDFNYSQLTINDTLKTLSWIASRHKSARCTCQSMHELSGIRTANVSLISLYPAGEIVVSLSMGTSHELNIANNVKLIENVSLIITMNCSASGNPLPDVYLNSKESILKLAVIRNISGNYTCIANNTMKPDAGEIRITTKKRVYTIDILYPPNILTNMSDAKLLEKDDITIMCSVKDGRTTNHSVMWLNNTGELADILQLTSITRKQRGNYTCELHYTMIPTFGNNTSGIKIETVSIDVLYPPENISSSLQMDNVFATNISKNISVIENISRSMELNCSALSNPAPAYIFWENNGNKHNKSIIQINADRNKKGIYTCHAINTMQLSNGSEIKGESGQNYSVDILYPPNILTNISDAKLLENDDITIMCSVKDGRTTNHSVMWLNNTRELADILQFTGITRKQRGNYTCELHYTMIPTFGNTTSGIKIETVSIDVLYPPENISSTLQMDSLFKNNISELFSVIENASRTVNLNCSALSNPPPRNIIWMINGTTRNSSKIQFTAHRNAKGSYTCHAINIMKLSNGSQIEGEKKQTYIVNILYPPEMKSEPVINIEEGENITINCTHISGVTTSASFEWIKNENTVGTNNSYLIVNASISNSGNYTCVVNYTLQPTYGEPKTASLKRELYLQVKPLPDGGSQGNQVNNPNNTGEVAGGVVGGLLAVAAVIVALYIVRKRGIFQKSSSGNEHHEYQNVGFTKDAGSKKKRLPALPPDDESEDVHVDHRAIAHQQDYDAEEHPYLNTLELIDLMKKITVSDLFSYVTNKSYQEFADEFAKFPSGLMVSIPCAIASKPQNAQLNRYQGIYPYDHSRVIISGQPDFFINASYIDGHLGEQEYIASLGPTVKHTLGFRTFWNMVWHERSDVIVMLTNLQEPSGMKCEKYWADKGTTRNIGDFTIQSVGEEVAADYKVRTFQVFKDDESRMVTQLHFTAWPDKKVPEDVTSLIEFRQRVKAAPTRSIGPLIVHCSAGVGRTGTYIALDRLIEEGKSKNAINVYDCVMNMRKQRVNMVQTLDQYVYLHQALVYCLVFDIEPVSSDGIDEYVKKTSNNVYSKLFQQLQQTVEEETIDEKEARARNGDMVDKNRKTADIPSDAHRIRLFLDKQMGESDYINAVYLNGFKRLGHFIIAQSPLPTSLDDFVCLLYQATCCCIVSLDDYTQAGANNVTYLPPDNQPMKYGTFTISCSNLDMKSGYSVRKLKLGHTGQFEKGEKVVYHFEFTGWKQDERTPKDPKLFVDFVKEVDKYATQLEDEHSHVLVHCMSGSERSGMFCAVYNLMDKMEQERQVSVVNMLRRVRARRRTAIPNMEQLKFCFQALNSFVKSYKI